MKKSSKGFLLTLSMICLIFVPAIATYSLATKSVEEDSNHKEDELISSNLIQINDMNEKDLYEIDKKINKIQSFYYGVAKNPDKINYKDIFSSSVIMGDSQAEGLTIYEILNSTSVVAKKGSNLIDSKSGMNTLSNLNPANIFTLYGMNDILIYQEDIDSFIKDYSSLISSINKTLPHCNVFVSSIFSVQEKVSNKKPIYNKVDEYNKALKSMCENVDATFIDSASLLDNNEDFYENDGMHFKPNFYPEWLNILKKSADL